MPIPRLEVRCDPLTTLPFREAVYAHCRPKFIRVISRRKLISQVWMVACFKQSG